MNLTLLHSDDRGQIFLIQEVAEFPEVAMFFTKKGFARGGCLHKKNNEYTCVISGSVEYKIGYKKIKLCVGSSATIPRNKPHYFVSLTDSVVLEWGATPEEKVKKHKAFRKIVDKINSDNKHTA